MKGSTTQIVKSKVGELIHADWNYKTDGTEEQITTLMNAITEAGSCGVLMVRQVKKGGNTKNYAVLLRPLQILYFRYLKTEK